MNQIYLLDRPYSTIISKILVNKRSSTGLDPSFRTLDDTTIVYIERSEKVVTQAIIKDGLSE